MKSFTHLSLDDRIQIQSCLGSHLSFKKIAALIHRDCTTISKEVRNHRTVVNSPRPYGKNNNCCQYATSCDRHHVCCRCTARRDERCSRCRVQNCNSVCPDFLENHCDRLSRAPLCLQWMFHPEPLPSGKTVLLRQGCRCRIQPYFVGLPKRCRSDTGGDR